ncbi:hypothetical protein HHI36_002545 [Cryptolaemus montrouzieri]|uniref:Cilia- and flagella-associated protein 263 n=1 Tax=Cryptolaemus montrouzieri TaxID=559131 RepID=A0ABD2PCC3_9CUCU
MEEPKLQANSVSSSKISTQETTHNEPETSEVTTLVSSVLDSTAEKHEAPVLQNEPTISPASTPSDSSSSSSGSASGEGGEGGEEDLEKPADEVKRVKRSPLDDLNDEDLAKTVSDLQTEVRHLTTENNMFERYLTINEPQLLEGMTQTIEHAIKMQGAEPVRRATLADNYSLKSVSSAARFESSVLGTSSIMEKGPRINLTQKSDMIMKETEELQKSLNKFYKESHKRKCLLKAQLEELGLELSELTETSNIFEQSVVIEGVDPLTQRIPAEKFIRFMQEWLKTSAATIQKYRLRQSTLSSHLKKLKETLKQKKELGESLHAVDFEKLQIENNHFIKEIDLRTTQLIDLKRMNGGANLILTNQKKFLMKQIVEMQQIQRDIDETRNKTEELERETEQAEEQLDKVKAHYESIRQMIEEYKVPDVMDYVKVKGKVYDLQKNIKIWSRRSHLQDVKIIFKLHGQI